MSDCGRLLSCAVQPVRVPPSTANAGPASSRMLAATGLRKAMLPVRPIVRRRASAFARCESGMTNLNDR